MLQGKPDFCDVLMMLFITCMCGFWGFVIGYSCAERSSQRQAIENNCAEWKCDSKTGVKTFTWKTKTDQE